MWPNCWEISSNSYKDIVFIRFFGLLPAMTLNFDPKGWSAYLWTHIQLWPKLGEITHIGFWDTVFTRFLGHCLLWSWILTFRPQNLISTSMNPKTSVTEIGWNFLNWFLRYGVHKVFGSLPAATFDLRPQNLISTSMNQKTSVTEIGWNFLNWFLSYGVHKVFETHGPMHSSTHSQTDRPK